MVDDDPPDAILGKIQFIEDGCHFHVGVHRPDLADESDQWPWQELAVVRLSDSERLQLINHLMSQVDASVIDDAPRVGHQSPN